MQKPILTNPDIFPTDEVIFEAIGSARPLWISLFEMIEANYADFEKEWRYYNDGHAWLMKVIRKKKTICWVTVVENGFKTTFYFADKAEPLIMETGISDELKEQFKTGKYFGKIRALTITYSQEKDIEYFKELIPTRLKV